MRIRILILITALLLGCVHQPRGFEYSDTSVYHPKPSIAVSAFSEKDRVVAAYVRHSNGGVLLQLTPSQMNYDISKNDINLAVTLDSSQHIVFNSGAYENFDRSRDLFSDGRIILVPLPEHHAKAVGAFVNLLSGKRYFFAPTLTSRESLAKVRTVARNWEVTVIVPEDRHAPERMSQFPEFRR